MLSTSGSHATISGSQTLTRGLEALNALRDGPLSITDLAARLEIHRSNAYRIVRTLEEHRYIIRDGSGLLHLGPKLAALARGVAPALQTAATPAMRRLAYTIGMTTFLTTLDGEEVITLVTVEPENVTATIARNPGVRHSAHRGAPGRALESSLTSQERKRYLGSETFSVEALQARERGYAISRSEVVQGVLGLAVPIRIANEPPAALAIVHFSLPDHLEPLIEELQTTAAEIIADYC